MAIRLDCGIDDTTLLLKQILTHAFQGSRVEFLCPPGMGTAVIQRVRVKLSRTRKKQKAKGKPRRHFLLNSTIHPYTVDGKRHDCVIAWTSQTEAQKLTESLEDMLGTGESL